MPSFYQSIILDENYGGSTRMGMGKINKRNFKNRKNVVHLGKSSTLWK